MRLTAAGVYALQLFEWKKIPEAIQVLKEGQKHIWNFDMADLALCKLIQ